MYYNVTVVIPALNPDGRLNELVWELHNNGFDDIVVVNDGSDAENIKYLPDESKLPFCTVLHHRRNRGKGYALRTAFKFFSTHRRGKDGVITMECDGRHPVSDVISVTEKMYESDSVVLGCRDFSDKRINLGSRIGNKITRVVFRLFCGIKITDPQAGLRAIPERFIPTFIGIKGSRYEYETNMLLEMKKQHIDFSETPIDAPHLGAESKSHFRPIADSVRIYKLILSFVFSSLLSMLIELTVFYLCLKFLFSGNYDVLFATLVARITSSIVNFAVNRTKVFGADNKLGRSLLRYIILAIPLALASIFSIKGLTLALNVGAPSFKTLLKCVVDTILFFVSFRIQQNWVFAPKVEGDEVEEDIPLIPLKKRLTPKKIILRTLASIGTAVLYLIVVVFSLVTLVAHGPSKTVRDALVLSAMQASATKWVPYIFLSKSTVDEIVDNSYVDTKLTVDLESYGGKDDISGNNQDDGYIDGIKYVSETHDTFKAYITLVKDPTRLFVGVSDETYTATKGKTVFEIAKKYDSVIAINGGEFYDENGQGLGNIPIGLTYSNGQCVWDEGGSRTFIGIDKNHRLVVSEGMTKSKADSIGITDGVSFKYGNTLIKSDSEGVHIYYKKSNTGVAQRTAIGQREDGTFILVVTDGRSASSIGATYNDVIDIMVSYGAVTAGMLDGGSSSVMYYENYFDIYNIDKNTLDEYQLKGLVNRYKAFFSPRRIPTYFCVRR